jgi:hypothetical protein
MAYMKKPISPLVFFENTQSFPDNPRGQITIGEIVPICRAALAAEGKRARVALVRRDNKTVAEFLPPRLEAALSEVIADNSVIDEVLPEIKRRRTR